MKEADLRKQSWTPERSERELEKETLGSIQWFVPSTLRSASSLSFPSIQVIFLPQPVEVLKCSVIRGKQPGADKRLCLRVRS